MRTKCINDYVRCACAGYRSGVAERNRMLWCVRHHRCMPLFLTVWSWLVFSICRSLFSCDSLMQNYLYILCSFVLYLHKKMLSGVSRTKGPHCYLYPWMPKASSYRKSKKNETAMWYSLCTTPGIPTTSTSNPIFIDTVELPVTVGWSLWPLPYPLSDLRGTAAATRCWCTPVGWRIGTWRWPSRLFEYHSIKSQQHTTWLSADVT